MTLLLVTRRVWWLLVPALVWGAADGQAQDRGNCLWTLDSARVVGRVIGSSGRTRQYGSGGVWGSCVGWPGTPSAGTAVWRAYADSLARFVSLGRVDFVNRVWFRDSTAELTADRATYFERDDRLVAEGNVRLANRKTGSVLTGSQLTYWRAIEGVRETAELYACRRPEIEYRTATDTVEPYRVQAQCVRLRGDDAWATGSVEINRTDFAARADSAMLRVNAQDGILIGHAEARSLDTLGYVLRGRKIGFRLTDNRLSWVQAQGLAEATSSEWRIVGDTIEFLVMADKIQNGFVWGDSTRARAISQTYTVTADSLAVDTPDQVLTELRGFGQAKATSKTDSLTTEADWMAGDTIVARFDSLETGVRTLIELAAWGNAQAFYFVVDEADSTATPAINYSRGERIVARFKEESLDRVTVVGQADGVYLEPLRRPPS